MSAPKNRLTGKQFESLLVDRHNEYKRAGIACIGRYGVQSVNTGRPIELDKLLEILRKVEFETVTTDQIERLLEPLGRRASVIQVQSLPDFEGIFLQFRDVPSPRGTYNERKPVIFDAKVCSQASWGLDPYREVPGQKKGARRRQLTHMYERSDFGATCFFLIHWNERELKTKYEPAETFLFPVTRQDRHVGEFWNAFEAAEVKSINREDCRNYGKLVPWTTIGRGRTLRPDWIKAL